MSETDANSSISAKDETLRLSVDLVAAATRNIGFLRSVADSQCLKEKHTILEAIRRYDQVWMPLIADLTKGSKPPMIFPPLDVEWVWFCHTMNPSSYRQYCESRFSKLIGKPTIFDEENKEYALNRCRKIWEHKFPSEPFENESDDPNLEKYSSVSNEDLFELVSNYTNLCKAFSEPYYSEMVYLIAAKRRYKCFINMIHKFANECSRLVPASDVLLMWITHQSYPTVYALDVKALEGDMDKIVELCEAVNEEDIEETKTLWEKTFNQPYEKAAGEIIAKPMANETPFYWDVTDTDVNTRYKTMVPRFLFEVCVLVKLNPDTKQKQLHLSREFLRFKTTKCHKELKLDSPLLPNFTSKSWQKALHIYCEFGTKELTLELRHRGSRFSRGSTLLHSVPFSWNDLLRAQSLTLLKEANRMLEISASITPPVQGSYLLKCVPDRVTDDCGSMVSDVILRMNQYRPQEGRWLSRTVLDHSGRECFVTRMRVGSGFWRRGGEAPKAVKWEERVIEIREGLWAYVTDSSSIGRAPEKVVGTATPKEPPEGYKASWSLSTGDELLIMWDETASISSMRFELQNDRKEKSMVKLLKGRKMQYQISKSHLENSQEKSFDEDEYLTIVRFSEENPIGKATALLNWKLLVMELLPEEDSVLVLLLSLSILRSVTEMKKEDVGSLLVRRRIREAKVGDRDWGSVILHPSIYSSFISSPNLHPWYWNAELFMKSQVKGEIVSPASSNYSQAEGVDQLYRSGIIS